MVKEKDVKEKALELLSERGVTMDHLVELVQFLQQDYFPQLSVEDCIYNIDKVLNKREVQNTIITGIHLDLLAENNHLDEPLLSMVKRDEGLYGVDETMALSIINIYGSIGFTNYGYIDKVKPGILERLNDKSTGKVNTFLDDIVGAIAAAASSRLAHSKWGNQD
ncbi:phosphatidylglycerophosphatase A [Microaerobacter geothermalis]|uniref:phosphatidylglycerophosphatase A family protein n=1 Tax=Microaerobacter geothermalis TaxID=674972 RepID=UPI001F2FDC23|nr:phosphatidylglycerophosphatase A [Microaerobacter geothermalis]MCF6092430.1 phosphatidylglycerophosphatase A [Microaerobacter geothermalis]